MPLNHLKPKPAKAALSSDDIRRALFDVMTEIVVRHYGSVKAAAISLRVSPEQLMRDFGAGQFHALQDADDITKATVFAAMHDAFGQLTITQHARATRNRMDVEVDRVMDVFSERRQA